jgi:MFS transporter, MHS family, proline/betaine transporter
MIRNNVHPLWASTSVIALNAYDYTVFLFLAQGIQTRIAHQSASAWLFILDLIVGLIARPIGALLFGKIADTKGRRPMLLLFCLLMGLATVFYCFLPFESGSFFRFYGHLLILFRLMQGVIFGSDILIANTYLAEIAPVKQRGFYSSFSQVGQEIGTMLAIIVSVSFFNISNVDYADNWGWRIPFISGFLSMLIGTYLRWGLVESHRFLETKKTKTPIFDLFKKYKIPMLKAFLIVPVVGISFYFFRVFILNQSQILKMLTLSEILILSLVSCFVSMCASSLGGFLSDLVGRRPILISSACLMLLSSWPIIVLVSHHGLSEMVFVRMLVGQIVMSIFSGLYSGALASQIAELFPTQVRATGTSFSYNLAINLGSGSLPVFNVYNIVAQKEITLPAIYLMIWALISIFVVSKTLKETARIELK